MCMEVILDYMYHGCMGAQMCLIMEQVYEIFHFGMVGGIFLMCTCTYALCVLWHRWVLFGRGCDTVVCSAIAFVNQRSIKFVKVCSYTHECKHS